MNEAAAIPGDVLPRLPRGVRLHYDDVRAQWTLLAPERILKPDGIALEILKRCDGKTSLDAIIDDLTQSFGAAREEVAHDVHEFLKGLATKRIVDL
jgi:pyrroloquinoline quinone biosynthesis protein D